MLAQYSQYTGCISEVSLQGICGLDVYFGEVEESVLLTEAKASEGKLCCLDDEIDYAPLDLVDDLSMEMYFEAQSLQSSALEAWVQC